MAHPLEPLAVTSREAWYGEVIPQCADFAEAAAKYDALDVVTFNVDLADSVDYCFDVKLDAFVKFSGLLCRNIGPVVS